VARSRPSGCKFAIIDEASLLETEDDCLSNIIFDATGLEVSEKLALTFRSGHKCIECDCVSYFVRVGAFASFNLGKLQRN
jgi:hypothetical protein